jgi:hypothetical protein
MTSDEQLKEWVKGNSIHNPDRDECCPDFSCCDPELLAPEDERKRFAEGNDELRMQMCMIFLQRIIVKENPEKANKITILEETNHGTH